MTPVVHQLLGTWVMRGSRIAERITGSLAATSRLKAEVVSGSAVVREDRDAAHIVKQTEQPEEHGDHDDADGTAAREVEGFHGSSPL